MSDENNKAEEIKEAAEEKIEDAKEAVTEKAEEIKEAAEEKIEDAKETVSAKTAEVKEKAVQVRDKAAQEAVKVKGSATKQPDIKKKKGVNKTTLTVIIVCAVVVLACLAFVGYKLGWFHVPAKAAMTMDDYSTIEVESADVEVTDSTVDSYLTNMQSYYTTTTTETTGTVEEGDSVHIVYTGTLDGVAFDGGSTGDTGTDITIGSSGYIDGFDDGLIGQKVGDTVDLNLTFPEDYDNEDLAGQDVVFTVEIQSKNVTNTPELTDDFIKENSAEYTEYYFGESTQIDTVEDYRQFIYDRLYDSYLKSAMSEALEEKAHITSYDEELYNEEVIYYTTMLSYYAQMYGVDAATFASYYGYETVEEYAQHSAEHELTHAMLFEKLASDLGITHTDEEVDAALTEYMEENELTDTYTLEEFKEANGEAWLNSYKNYEMNREPVLEALKDRVVIVESEPETEAEAEGEAETAE